MLGTIPGDLLGQEGSAAKDPLWVLGTAAGTRAPELRLGCAEQVTVPERGLWEGAKDAPGRVLRSFTPPFCSFGPQGSALARQIGAVAYAECSSKVSENSVRDVFHVTTLASVNRVHKNLKRSNSKRGLKRASQMPGRTDLLNDTEIRKDRAKSCSIM